MKKIFDLVNRDFFKKYKNIIIPIVVLLIVLLIALIIFLVNGKSEKSIASNEEDKMSAITEKGILKNESFGSLEFSNVTLVKDKGIYTLSIDVKNVSNEVSKVMSVDIPIKDKDGNVVVTLLGYIGKELKPNEVTTITASTSADLSNAYTKEIVERK